MAASTAKSGTTLRLSMMTTPSPCPPETTASVDHAVTWHTHRRVGPEEQAVSTG
jgi:hypothetical protein